MTDYLIECASNRAAASLDAWTRGGIGWLLVLLVVSSAPVFSSEPTQEASRLSEGQPGPALRADKSEPEKSGHPILSAKTVCVGGQLGTVVPELFSQFDPNPAYAKKQVEKVIRKWGRFKLVEDPEQADLVLVIVEGTKEITYAVENPKWYENPEKSESLLVDKLLVFKGGKNTKAEENVTLLWDSGEVEYGAIGDLFRLRMPATAAAIKFRRFVEELEKRKPK
jgi:hypothetical protein